MIFRRPLLTFSMVLFYKVKPFFVFFGNADSDPGGRNHCLQSDTTIATHFTEEKCLPHQIIETEDCRKCNLVSHFSQNEITAAIKCHRNYCVHKHACRVFRSSKMEEACVFLSVNCLAVPQGFW